MLLVQSQAYRQQYGINSVVLFPVNLYGPRDNFDLAVVARHPGDDPQVRRGARARRRAEVALWGDGSPTREFLYVEDAAEGILLAAERYDVERSGEPRQRRGDHHPRPGDARSPRPPAIDGRFVWDTSKPNGQPRRQLDVTARPRALRLRGQDPVSTTGLRADRRRGIESNQKEIESR